MEVIQGAGHRVGLAGEAEFVQAVEKFFQMLAAEIAEHVVARDRAAMAYDQRYHRRSHQRVVERGDHAPRRRIRFGFTHDSGSGVIRTKERRNLHSTGARRW